jgi:hypothetical protein
MKHILCILQSKESGIDYHRLKVPYTLLAEKYKSEITVDFFYSWQCSLNNLIFWKKYDTVIFNAIVTYEDIDYIDKIKAKGIKVIVDIDDYWHLESTHPSYEKFQKNKESEIRLHNIKQADVVTCASAKLLSTLLEHNANTYLLPNCIEPRLSQYSLLQSKPLDKIVGWIGGSSHLDNIELIKGIATNNNYKFALCGFNNIVTTQVPMPSGRKITDTFDAKERGAFARMEKILTNHYQNFDAGYIKYLNKFEREGEQNYINEKYIRLWSDSVDKYPFMYNYLHTVLYPLHSNPFNSYKSNLRLIESFWFGCQVIASEQVRVHKDFEPFITFVDDRKGSNEWKRIVSLQPENNIEGAREIIKQNYLHENYLALRKELI